MANWDEYRTAFYVAQEGTVSGAALALGVHHATVIRHIDALEDRLGTKLFQRHPRGYTPTEAGLDLLQVARTTEDQFAQLQGRLKGRGNDVAGELVVTSLPGLSPLMIPVLARFREIYPEVTIRYLTSSRVFRLEYGEAHVAIRAGRAPEEPDNVVQKLYDTRIGLYGSKSYVARNGQPVLDEELATHEFVVGDGMDKKIPFYGWLLDRVSPERAVFRVTEQAAVFAAVKNGAGLGFLPTWAARQDPDLVEVMAPREEWQSKFWLVTHMALHRTAKVQAFLTHLKEATAEWDL